MFLTTVCMLFTKETRVALLCGNCVPVVSSHHHQVLYSGVLSKFSADSAQCFSFILCCSMHVMVFLQLHVHVHGIFVHAMVTLVKLFCGCR